MWGRANHSRPEARGSSRGQSGPDQLRAYARRLEELRRDAATDPRAAQELSSLVNELLPVVQNAMTGGGGGRVGGAEQLRAYVRRLKELRREAATDPGAAQELRSILGRLIPVVQNATTG